MRRRCCKSKRISGRETILVGRPGFKPGGWRHASLGGFDSHSLPPLSCTLARLSISSRQPTEGVWVTLRS